MLHGLSHLFSRRGVLLLGALALGGLLAVAGANLWMTRAARARTFTDVSRVPVTEVALVLGTSPTLRHQRPNPFFEHRMDAAAQLWRAGRVRHLLLSGDNRHEGYDEPTAMQRALLTRGVPASAMTLDYAGFRTLDSLARARQVFGLRRLTIVTDDFHEPRSLFLADAFGLEAVAFPSRPVALRASSRTRAREIVARAAACVDVWVLHRQPHFSGPREEIRLALEREHGTTGSSR